MLSCSSVAASTKTRPNFAAAVRAFIRQGRATGAILDDENERLAAQSLLDFWANQLGARRSRDARSDPGRVRSDARAGAPGRAMSLSRAGCLPPNDRPFFFGRQRLLEQLLDHLRQDRLLAVIGSSGSGKSSLVLAGLVPALQAGALPGSAAWRYLPPLTPGSDPLASLARAVARSVSDGACRSRIIHRQAESRPRSMRLRSNSCRIPITSAACSAIRLACRPWSS